MTPDSVRTHREVLKYMPILRRLTKSKLNDEQVRTMSEILESLKLYVKWTCIVKSYQYTDLKRAKHFEYLCPLPIFLELLQAMFSPI